MTDCYEKPPIHSGQLWEQREFPFCRRAVMMTGGKELRFCLMSVDENEPPNVCVEEGGTWVYTEQELLDRFRNLKYELTGDVRLRSVYPNSVQVHGVAIDAE